MMPSLSEVHKVSTDILFAQKMNTLVTGLGFLFLSIIMVFQTVTFAYIHKEAMQRIQTTQDQKTTVNVEKDKTRDDHIMDIVKMNKNRQLIKE